MEDLNNVKGKPPFSESSPRSPEEAPLPTLSKVNTEESDQPNNSFYTAATTSPVNHGLEESATPLPVAEPFKLATLRDFSDSQIAGQDEFFPVDDSASTSNDKIDVTDRNNQETVIEDSEHKAVGCISNGHQLHDGPTSESADDEHVGNQRPLSVSSSENEDTQNDYNELKADPPQIKLGNVAIGDMGKVESPLDGKQLDDSPETKDIQKGQRELKVDPPQIKADNDFTGDLRSIDSPAYAKQDDINKGHIDTAAPIESVKAAVSKFGGIVDWKARKVEAVERQKFVEQELEKAREDISEYKKQSETAEMEKVRVLKELNSTKRQIEELKLNLERAQTEEHQARQDTELSLLRVEEMEQGIADESSVARQAQLEVAKARYTAAVSELQYVKEELEALYKEYASLVTEKDVATKKAEEAMMESKEVEKTVEELSIELIATRATLESSHAAHLEAEEKRMETVIAREKDSINWEKKLKLTEEEIQTLNQQVLSAKDLKSKQDIASALRLDLKAKLAAYMESNIQQEGEKEGFLGDEEKPEKRARNDIQVVVGSAKKELEDVKLDIGRATGEINGLKVAATSLRSELEQRKSDLAAIKQREGTASIAVASLEAELDRTRLEIAFVQMKEKEAEARVIELSKKLQEAFEEANQANLLAQAAREELGKAEEEAEQAKAKASTLQSRLLAAQKELEDAKASESLAIAAIKALKESESTRSNNDVDPSIGTILSLEEYYQLRKQAHEAEEQASMRVIAANSQIEIAKESELKTLEKLEEGNREMAALRESLKVAMEKAEKAQEGKLGVEQEFRRWRAEHEQRQTNGELHPNKSREFSLEGSEEVKDSDQAPASTVSHFMSSPEGYHTTMSSPELIPTATAETGPSLESKSGKKKRRSLFPRFLMFFARKKSHPTKQA